MVKGAQTRAYHEGAKSWQRDLGGVLHIEGSIPVLCLVFTFSPKYRIFMEKRYVNVFIDSAAV